MRLIFTVILILTGLIATASPAVAVPGLEQIWLHAPTQYKVTEKTSLIGDLSPRFGTDDGQLDQMILRTGVQRKLTRNVSGTLGFDSVDNYDPSRNHENRIWQQIQAQHRIKSYTFTSRIRMEERHWNGTPGSSVRWRMMMKSAQKIGASRFSVIYSDELFLTLNTMPDGPVAGVDRNRLFAGMGYAIDRNKNLEAGYRVEYINKTDTDDETRRQIVVQMASMF
ncbi:DUF2490 domain-containing protein [Candidatus Obscuribacterales bacterium]|nr:DUF2490 domain-containing protein [Candidatus Obscuribacterales bacterium]MBX3152399.1 DUF2490 domain-containing protein [Candidatus Obscuribacterales bacterium]